MKDKDEKKKNLEDLRKTIEENDNIFVTSYEKLTVNQDYRLRKTIREAGGQYRVVKNNLAAKAAEGTRANDLLGDLKGMT
jgi:large subunit ribosomal protein L10